MYSWTYTVPPPPLPVCLSVSNDGGADLSAVGSGQKFFAKGTGFGSGSLRSGWDMKQVREAQKENEQQVECCLKVGVTCTAWRCCMLYVSENFRGLNSPDVIPVVVQRVMSCDYHVNLYKSPCYHK